MENTFKKQTAHKNKSLSALMTYIDKNVDWGYSLDINRPDKTNKYPYIFFEYPSGYPITISKTSSSFVIKSWSQQVPLDLLQKVKIFVKSNVTRRMFVQK